MNAVVDSPSPTRPAGFADRLAVSVTLTIAGTEYAFIGGGVPHVELRLETHGFSGVVELLAQNDTDQGGGFEDTLIDAFLGSDLVEVKLEVAAVFHHPETSESLQSIVVAGLATHKSMEELLLTCSLDRPVLVRRYRLELADPARVLWSQHFPCQLYTDNTLQAVIDEHIGEHITFTYDWAELSESRPQLMVHLPPAYGASFLDFVVWTADVRGGVLTYDYAEQQYALTELEDSSADALALFGDDIRTAHVVVPPVPRHVVVVADSYANGTRSETIEQDQAVTGVRHDRPMRSPISQDVDDEVTLQRSRLRLPKYEAELCFARWPTVDVVPGTLLTLAAANRWSEGSALVTPTWRVRELRLRATMPAGPLDHDQQSDSTGYRVELSARLAQSDDTRVSLPPYRAPTYPAYVEGKVVSEKGEDGEKTYQTYTNETTSLDEYTVKVPLWDDQTVTAPFEPVLGSGNVYVPCYRDERVLLAMELESSRIERLLEWREGAALSMDVQGEQILFGKSSTSNTSVNHVYDDDQPVLNVLRTNADDSVLIKLSEGDLLLRVQEVADGTTAANTLVCTFEGSKTAGVTIKVVKADESVTQTVSMDGTTMKLEVAGSSDTSSITIEEAKITISTKDLVITASNTIDCQAESTASFKSKETSTIESTSADVVVTAKTDVTVSGDNIKLSADTDATTEGSTAKVSASQTLTLSGSTEAKLSGSTVKVTADSTLNAESSGMATLGGNMTTIKGTQITAG